MYIKIGLLFFSVLMPLTSFAAKGNFDFSVAGQKTSFGSECVESIQYVETDEVYSENIDVSFTDECGDKLSNITRENIGKPMTIFYSGNKLTTASIVSRIGKNLRIQADEMPRVLLMQLIKDYDVDLPRHRSM